MAPHPAASIADIRPPPASSRRMTQSFRNPFGVNTRSVFALVLASLAAALPTGSAAAARAPADAAALAPADEYFSRLRMSALAIRLRIGTLARRYHARASADADLVHDARDVETALYGWRDRYPRDPWLAPTAYHLEQLYQAVQTAEARERATALLHFIVRYFGPSSFGRTSRLRLAQGLPPLHDESPVVASPAPASPDVSAAPLPLASGAARGSPLPVATGPVPGKPPATAGPTPSKTSATAGPTGTPR